MAKLKKIIFLDIDGPIINTPCYFIDQDCSKYRSFMNTQAIGYLTKLVDLSGAKIVTNSTHNFYVPKKTNRNLKDDLIGWGLRPKHFHRSWRTQFAANYKNPQPDELSKEEAISQWTVQNGAADWICIDDEEVMTDQRLFMVRFKFGLNLNVFNAICQHWRLDKDELF